MIFVPLPISGAYLVRLSRLGDHRGNLMRVFCAREFEQIGLRKPIVQINRSRTARKGTIRGMHYQKPPNAEIKLVSCLKGQVFDVLLDVRRDSPTFLRWHSEQLIESSDRLLVVPEGVAHGFQALRDNTELLYFHTAFHTPSDEAGVRFDDPKVQIAWPLEPTEVSIRDRRHPLLTPAFQGISL